MFLSRMFNRSRLGLAVGLLSLCFWAVSTQTALMQDESPVAFAALVESITPWDAVPAPDGSTIYFTALGSDGQPGVFSVASEGGAVTTLAAGSPFAMPLGLATSTDGSALYVADPWTAGPAGNAIFVLSSAGGVEPTVVAGTEGLMPQGIEVASVDGADVLYFTGIDLADGQPAVYSIAAAGGSLTQLAKGAPLVAPSGITIAKDGTVYVLDRLASGNGLGSVLQIKDGAVEEVAVNVRTGGQIAGLTLTLDESLLLVSSLNPDAGTAQVLVVALPTMETSIVDNVISANTAAGGLHRAHAVNEFAWADLTAGNSGAVYKVTFK